VLTECCLEILPRKMSAERSFFEAVAPVLSTFFDFLAARGLLPAAGRLSKAAAQLDKDIVAASQDQRNWGPAKAFIMAAEQAGVNTCDQAAMGQFLIQHNLRQIARVEAAQKAPRPRPSPVATPKTPVPSQPKAGRNDPCPCGSGKKFKKCCGA
jgi:hypothetical protein